MLCRERDQTLNEEEEEEEQEEGGSLQWRTEEQIPVAAAMVVSPALTDDSEPIRFLSVG